MIPQKLILYNFLSHDKSEIDFSTFNSAVILGSYYGSFERSNGSGKSSIFKSLAWVLYGIVDHKKKDGVVKKDKKYCKVEFTFESGCQIYRITRKRDKVISESEVILEQFDGSLFKDISCDTNTLTNEKIENIIGLNYEVFINSVYFKQNDISLFADTTPSKRKDIIKALLRIEKWDLYQKKAKDKAKTLLTCIEEKIKNQIPIDNILYQLNECEKNCNLTKDIITKQNNRYIEINSSLSSKRSQFSGKNDLIEKLKQLNKDWNISKNQIDDNLLKIKENSFIIDKYEKSEKILKANIKALTDKIKSGKNIDITKIQTSLVFGRTKENILKEKIIQLEKELKLGANCPTCKKALSKQDVVSLIQNQKIELNKIKNEFNETKNKLQSAEKKAIILQNQANSISESELEKSKLELKLNKCLNTLLLAKNDLDCKIKENELLNSKNYESQINTIKSKLSKDGIDKLNKEIIQDENEILILKSTIDKFNIEYGSLIQNKENLTKQIKLQKEIQIELDKLNSEYIIFDKLRGFFGKEGIQSIIIENILDELTAYTNDTLNKICTEPTMIAIKTQKQNDNGNWTETLDIEVTINGHTNDFEIFSGGEKFRISLALRLALSNILNKRSNTNIKFLLLDEVTSSLDDKGIELFVNMIKTLSNDIKILIITHDDKLKGQFSDIIIVDKTSSGSKIIKQ